MNSLLDLPRPVLVALALLAATQLALQVWGVIDLARRPGVPARSRWTWALVVMLGGIVGATVYLAVGRRALVLAAAPPRDVHPNGDRDRRRREGIDRLYDDREA